MQAVIIFSLSFVLTVLIGSLFLPETPRAASPTRAPVSTRAPTLDFLPGLPSLTGRTDTDSKDYERASQLVRNGQYRAAENIYLQILTRDPQDSRAMQGLVTLQRLLTNQDPQKLSAQAEAYRQANAKGRGGEEQYSPPQHARVDGRKP